MIGNQFIGKYLRLRSELDAAYAEAPTAPGRTGRIVRTASELARAERTLAIQRPGAHLIMIDDATPANSCAPATAAA